MKKLSKALVAGAASAAMLFTGFAGVSSAYAIVTDNATITFKNPIAGDKVIAYRILNIESEADGQYVFSVNAENKAALIAGLKAAKITVADDASDADLIKAITAKDALTADNIDAFAKAFKEAGPTAAAEEAATTDGVSVQQGYYLIDHTTIGEGDTYTASKYMVTTVGKDGAEVTLKNGTVTLEKKVKDNDTDNEDWQDSADYNIGDNVPFQLTGTLPANYGDFDTYYYEFQDTLSAGLTYNNDVKVEANGTDITSCFDVTGALNSIVANNLKKCAVEGANLAANTEIVVTYTAELNENATIGATGNPNTAKLVFSNNPNKDEKGTTPEDKVKVFTFKLDVDKTFSITPNEKDLPKFKLQKKNADGTYVDYANGAEKAVTVTGTNDDGSKTYGVDFTGLDAGDYKLVESYVPAGFNKADDIDFTVTANHEAESDDPQLIDLNVSNDKMTADKTTGVLGASVLNQGGNKLPSTGGMGTTILYTIGALIVLAAGAGLAITMRRRNNA